MKIEGFVGNLEINTSNMSDILRRLAAGDIIRAKVLEMASDELILKLFDGTTLSARSLTSIEAKQGDVIDFVVKNNSNNQLILETLKENGHINKANSTDIITKKQLFELGIKPDKANMEIANEIKQNELPLTKEVFSKIADTIISFKNMTPQKAAYLISNNIIPEEKNITLLNQIIDNKLKIGPMIQDTLKTLSEITDKDVMTSISNAIKDTPSNTTIDSGKNTNDSGKNTKIRESSKQEFIRSIIDKEFKMFGEIKDPAIKEIKSKVTEFITNNLNEKNNTVLREKEMQLLKSNVENFDKTVIKQDSRAIESILKNIIVKVRESTHQTYGINGENVLEQPSKEVEYKKNLENIFDRFFMKVDGDISKEDFNVNKLYKDMFEKLEIIKSAVEQTGIGNKDEILNKIDNLQNNLRFINEINNHSTYIQIPLNIFNKNTTGELYVLKKGTKGKKIDPQNATVLISLNTQNLGQIDTLISVNRKNISLNIRVEDSSLINFIKENHKELYNGLLDKGYKLVDVRYRLIDEEVNAVNVNRNIKKELDLNRQSIDYKI